MFQLLKLENGNLINLHQIVQIIGLVLHMTNGTPITVTKDDLAAILRYPIVIS